MSKPVVAIVGRPNVGKSTLFNALAGERISIVQDTPGVTRDRIYAEVSWLDHNFTMIDTGGIEPDSNDIILSQMREQAEIAIATADVIMFIVDVRQGLQDSDSKVADMLRRSGKPVVLVVNKVDSFEKYMADVYEFYNLGIGDPFPVSAASMLGLGDMLDEVVKYFPEYKKNDEEDDRPKIAIIGKPNVGKSSLINKLAQEDRVIVSDIAGTTRDAIDTDIKYNGKEYVFIDTAGLRRKNKIKEEIERYSIIRAVTAVERADVCIIVIDATEGVTEQDAKIAGIAHDRGKGIIIAVNKWDAIEKDDKTIYRHTEKIRDILSFMPYAEIIFMYYFNDMKGCVLTGLAFCLITMTGSMISSHFTEIWYGAGLVAGSFAGWTVAYRRLQWMEKHLDIHIFCNGHLLKKKKGDCPSPKVFDRYEQ